MGTKSMWDLGKGDLARYPGLEGTLFLNDAE